MRTRYCIRTTTFASGFLLLALPSGCADHIVAPPAITVSVSPTTVTLVAGGVQNFTATVTNDPASRGVTWRMTGCTGGVTACGSLINSLNTATTYSAPAPVPSDATIDIIATSVTDNTKSFTATTVIAAIGVSISPSSASVPAGGTQQFTATVRNDPTNNGVTWSLTGCSGGPTVCGSLTNVTNSTAIYAAPATIPPGSLGIKAASVTDNTKVFTSIVAGDIWFARAPMPTAHKFAVAAVIDSTLYVAGGCCTSLNEYNRALEAYDPATNTWVAKAQIPTLRYGSVAGVINGILYVTAGLDSTTIDAYDPATDTWTTKAATMHAFREFATGAVLNGKLYVVGGEHFTAISLRSVEAYDPVTNVWTTKAPMPISFAFGAAGVVNGVLYVAAGGVLLAYDQATDTWTTRAPVPTPRVGAVAGVVNGMFYLVGGWDQSGVTVLRTLEAYDPISNTWSTKTEMPAARAGAVAGGINSILYVAGGLLDGPALAIVEAYRP